MEIEEKYKILDKPSYVDEAFPQFKIMIILFSQKKNVYMILGKQETSLDSKDNESMTSADLSEEEVSERDKDDDSPYFVRITLDNKFLAYLEEPSLVEPMEVEEHIDILLENDVFREIVRNEMKAMFNLDLQKEKEQELEEKDKVSKGLLRQTFSSDGAKNLLKIAENINEESELQDEKQLTVA